MVCAIVAAFVAGISLGALAARKSDLMQIALSDATAAISLPDAASPHTFPDSTH